MPVSAPSEKENEFVHGVYEKLANYRMVLRTHSFNMKPNRIRFYMVLTLQILSHVLKRNRVSRKAQRYIPSLNKTPCSY